KKIRTFFCRYHINLSVKVNKGLITLAAEKRHFGTASAAERIDDVNCWNLPRLHATIFHLSRPKRPHQIICSLPHGDYENGQKLKATLVDNLRRAHTEDTRAKENPSGENCSDSEAHRRCYSAKGVQPWIIARFTSSLNNGSSLRKRSPASCGVFLMVRGDVEPKRSELFGASTHLRAVSLR